MTLNLEVLSEEECGLCVEVVVVGEEGSEGVLQWSSVVICGLLFRKTTCMSNLFQAYFCLWQRSWNGTKLGVRGFCIGWSGVGTLVVRCTVLFLWRASGWGAGFWYFLTLDDFWLLWCRWWSCNVRWTWNVWNCVCLWCCVCEWSWKWWLYMGIDRMDVLPVAPVPATFGFYKVWPSCLSLTYYCTF